MSHFTHKLLFLVIVSSNWTFGQNNVLKYSIKLFSDTTIHDTIRINISYRSDLGERNGYIKVKRVESNFSVQVFWKTPNDSAGFLTQSFTLDTSYNIATAKLLTNLNSDSKRANPDKILDLTQWKYIFIVPNKPDEISYDKRGLYLYHRLRYNSFLIL